MKVIEIFATYLGLWCCYSTDTALDEELKSLKYVIYKNKTKIQIENTEKIIHSSLLHNA